MESLTLYTRPDCHLCDDAEELLCSVAPEFVLVKVDIEDDLALLERYGLKIPVLQRSGDAAELAWPFDAAGLRRFLSGG